MDSAWFLMDSVAGVDWGGVDDGAWESGGRAAALGEDEGWARAFFAGRGRSTGRRGGVSHRGGVPPLEIEGAGLTRLVRPDVDQRPANHSSDTRLDLHLSPAPSRRLARHGLEIWHEDKAHLVSPLSTKTMAMSWVLWVYSGYILPVS